MGRSLIPFPPGQTRNVEGAKLQNPPTARLSHNPSDHSMNSKWVQTEISKALERERKKTRWMLFPVKGDCS
jgi:hypothetical protein